MRGAYCAAGPRSHRRTHAQPPRPDAPSADTRTGAARGAGRAQRRAIARRTARLAAGATDAPHRRGSAHNEPAAFAALPVRRTASQPAPRACRAAGAGRSRRSRRKSLSRASRRVQPDTGRWCGRPTATTATASRSRLRPASVFPFSSCLAVAYPLLLLTATHPLDFLRRKAQLETPTNSHELEFYPCPWYPWYQVSR